MNKNEQKIREAVCFDLDTRIPDETEYRQAISKGVHEIFDNQARSNPDALALICGNRKLTYGELLQKATALSADIISSGAGKESPVGIFMGRSVESIISMLAILYAGAAYLPIDPLLPDDRVRFMLDDSKTEVLLAGRKEYTAALRYSNKVLVVDAESIDPRLSPGQPDIKANPESLAYLMYTSGSTGTPKGVEILHKGIVRLVFGDYARFGPGETFLHMASPSFDASTYEIWGALLHGSPLVILSERVPGINDIRKAIETGVTTALLTSSYFNAVTDEAPDALCGLRQLCVGGEQLSISHIRSALKSLSGATILNLYGPTENSVVTCFFQIPRHLEASETLIPIGKPIRGTTVFILDKEGLPVNDGERGELFTGGDGVARGYLNRPELTRTRFLPDPFSEIPGARMYMTGDIVRRRPDGLIEFLGRVDDQVKIRGFRVEPNEVHSVIVSHPLVHNAVVLPMTDFTGDKHLIVYIVPVENTTYDEENIRTVIEQRLPEYMHPSFYIRLDSMPLKVNGKVDRDALPSPWGTGGEIREDEYSNDLEVSITRLWFAVLGCVVIGRDLNVFDFGAKSIHAVRVHQRLQGLLNKQFPVTALFEYPTIKGLAEYLGTPRHHDTRSAIDIKSRVRRQGESFNRMQHRLKGSKVS